MFRTARALLFLALVGPAAGCTLFPDKQPAPLNLTTSAQRVNEIFWADVAKGNWDEARTLLSAQCSWSLAGNTLTDRDAVMAQLHTQGVAAAQVSNASVQGNGDSMTVTFTLQWSAKDGQTHTEQLVSVWQRMPGKKAPTPYLLTVLAHQAGAR